MANEEIRPHYYGGEEDPFEPVKVIRAWELNFNLGSVLKYIRRCGLKENEHDIEALKKARTYLDIEIRAREAEQWTE